MFRRILHIILLPVLAFLLFSCRKEESPEKPLSPAPQIETEAKPDTIDTTAITARERKGFHRRIIQGVKPPKKSKEAKRDTIAALARASVDATSAHDSSRENGPDIANPLVRDLAFEEAMIQTSMYRPLGRPQKPPDSLKWEDIAPPPPEYHETPGWMKALDIAYKVATAIGLIYLIFFDK
jgi:hypothetical protein